MREHFMPTQPVDPSTCTAHLPSLPLLHTDTCVRAPMQNVKAGGGYGGGMCTEIDLLEANNHALQSAIHMKLGGSFGSGECDRNGCFSRIGGPMAPGWTQSLYGKGSRSIDTLKPFDVRRDQRPPPPRLLTRGTPCPA